MVSKNSSTGSGHVNSHPYPDKMISGGDTRGPVVGKSHMGKMVSKPSGSTMNTRPPAFKK